MVPRKGTLTFVEQKGVHNHGGCTVCLSKSIFHHVGIYSQYTDLILQILITCVEKKNKYYWVPITGDPIYFTDLDYSL